MLIELLSGKDRENDEKNYKDLLREISRHCNLKVCN